MNQTKIQIKIFSQNKPGLKMGMGHYERLFFDGLHKTVAFNGQNITLTMMFDGRSRNCGTYEQGELNAFASIKYVGASFNRLKLAPWWLVKRASRLLVSDSGANIYHSMALNFPPPIDKPIVYTIHDLPPARFADEGVLPTWSAKAAKSAAAIMTPSEFSKRELIELLGVDADKVHVLPYGCEHDQFHPGVAAATREELSALGIKTPYVIYAGGCTRRKNVRNLLTAWKAVSPKHAGLSLVLAGPKEAMNLLVAEISPPATIIAGYLNRHQLSSAIRASDGLVFPSIYEGFGLPPLEALAMGVPVMAVRAGAVPEVVGEAAVLAEAGDPSTIAEAINQMLTDSSYRGRVQTAGPAQAGKFSWEQHAAKALSIYCSLVKQ